MIIPNAKREVCMSAQVIFSDIPVFENPLHDRLDVFCNRMSDFRIARVRNQSKFSQQDIQIHNKLSCQVLQTEIDIRILNSNNFSILS